MMSLSEINSEQGTRERNRKILEAIANLLRGNQEPTPTEKILELLQEHDLPIPWNKPLNNISALLSYYPAFRAHGRRGWTYEGKI
jgi:hypothetical protein